MPRFYLSKNHARITTTKKSRWLWITSEVALLPLAGISIMATIAEIVGEKAWFFRNKRYFRDKSRK